MNFNGLPKLDSVVLNNNPMLDAYDLKCFFDNLFIPRANKVFSFTLTFKNTPAFTDELILYLRRCGMDIADQEPASPVEAKTYLISKSPTHRLEDSAPVSNPTPVLSNSGPKSRGLLYRALAVGFILGIFAPRLFGWALRLINSLRKVVKATTSFSLALNKQKSKIIQQ